MHAQNSVRSYYMRAALLSLALTLVSFPASAAPVVAIDLMQTLPGEQADYLQFVNLNWAPARAMAVERGAVRDYEILSRTVDGESWDVMLRTTYVDEDAYARREEIFAEIFEARGSATLIDGKRPRDMARFLDDGRAARIGGESDHAGL